MCGLAGIFDYRNGSPATPEQLRAMTRVIAHRGPDGDGHWIHGAVGLGHRRLAIIDLEGGVQPMHDPTGQFTIVFNGEIYNYAEFVAPLAARGRTFKTRSDTEVILNGWAEQGPACLAGFRGMFAFALWDAARRTLYLVRDRLGVKPLYYADINGRLTFGSEVKTLLTDAALPRDINPEAMATYLAHGFLPGDTSMLSAVHQVPPGAFLEVTAGGAPRLHTWYRLRGPPPLTIR
ncbi:MAG: asparagine synthase [bacterium]|nr:MAG: asparagine synthase [bacterium]